MRAVGLMSSKALALHGFEVCQGPTVIMCEIKPVIFDRPRMADSSAGSRSIPEAG